MGVAPVGVAATTDVEAILAIPADCVVYTPRLTDVDEVCAILASGKNVVTTAFLFHPERAAPADREKLLAACRAGVSTLHGCGLNPGNLSGALPLALTGMSRAVEQVWLLADVLHAGIDEVTADVEAVAAERDHEIFGN